MKVAIVYDRVNKWGGAERVLLALHEMFPNAPLYTSVYSPELARWAKVFPKVTPSFLQNFPLARTRHDLYASLMPLAFESFDFSEYDLVISVTSEAAKGIKTLPKTKHICYMLTPTRYLWSGYDEYFNTSFKRSIATPVVELLRRWDKEAAKRPDKIISISKTVAGRVWKFYGRRSRLIYPPVSHPSRYRVSSGYSSLATSHLLESERPRSRRPAGLNDYYLVVSRLVPYKKVDLVINVFNQLNKQLVIVGTGSEERRLKSMAKRSIKFAGDVSDAKLASYYRGCKALIFPQEEDFGIVAVEAQLFGKPVIAYRAGGAKETVIDGKTGIFFNEQTSGAILDAVEKFKNMRFDTRICQDNAHNFSSENFKRKFMEELKKICYTRKYSWQGI